MYVTEDTTRSDPDTLSRLFGAAIDAGATRICIADTVGHATPDGRPGHRPVCANGSSTSARRRAWRSTGTGIATATWARSTVSSRSRPAPRVCMARCSDWASGSATRLSTPPGKSGADGLDVARPHPPERSGAGRVGGNRRADSRQLPGVRARRLPHGNGRSCRGGRQGVQQARSRPGGYGVFGRPGAARRPGAGRSKSGLSPGSSNVIYWLEQRGIEADDELVDRIFRLAKRSRMVLTEQEILREIELARRYATTRLDA